MSWLTVQNINFLYVNDFVPIKINFHAFSITDITFTGLDLTVVIENQVNKSIIINI